MTTLRTSVIVPTLNHRDLLRGCLKSLLRQSRPPDEIVVVDNGSGDGTAELVRREFALRARLVGEERRGVQHARNRGIAEARGELLLFTDDDVRCPPRWVELLAACFDDPATACAGGPTRPLWVKPPPEALLRSRRLRSALGIVDYGPRRKRLDPATEFLIGANLACRRGAVLGGAGFKGVFPFPPLGACADDYELSRRLARGRGALYEPAAWVEHRIEPAKTRWGYLLMRVFLFAAAGARLGSRLRPRRGPRELLGAEGAVSAADALGHILGRCLPGARQFSSGAVPGGSIA